MKKLYLLYLIVNVFGLISYQANAQQDDDYSEVIVQNETDESANIAKEQGLKIKIDKQRNVNPSDLIIYKGPVSNNEIIDLDPKPNVDPSGNVLLYIKKDKFADSITDLHIYSNQNKIVTIKVTKTNNVDKPGKSDEEDSVGLELTAAIEYIIDNDDSFFGNLKPQVWLGSRNLLNEKHVNIFFDWGLMLHGYNVEGDSTNLLPALMLPGPLNFTGLFVFEKKVGKNEDKALALYAPVGVGAKYITNISDTINNFLQTHIKLGFGLRYGNTGSIDINYVFGNHNATSTSNRNFEKYFNATDTEIRYVVVNIVSLIPALNSHFFIRWVNLINENKFSQFPNERIITLGIKRDFNLSKASGTTSRALKGGEMK